MASECIIIAAGLPGQAGDAARAASTEARVIRGGPGTVSVRLKVRLDGAGVQHVNHLS